MQPLIGKGIFSFGRQSPFESNISCPQTITNFKLNLSDCLFSKKFQPFKTWIYLKLDTVIPYIQNTANVADTLSSRGDNIEVVYFPLVNAHLILLGLLCDTIVYNW